MKTNFTDEESEHWEKLVALLPYNALREVMRELDGEDIEYGEQEMRDYLDNYWPEDYAYTFPLYRKIKSVAKKCGCFVELKKALPLTDNVKSTDIISLIIEKVVLNRQKTVDAGFDYTVASNSKKWKRGHKWKEKGLWDRSYSCDCGKDDYLQAEVRDDGEKITECKIYKVKKNQNERI